MYLMYIGNKYKQIYHVRFHKLVNKLRFKVVFRLLSFDPNSHEDLLAPIETLLKVISSPISRVSDRLEVPPSLHGTSTLHSTATVHTKDLDRNRPFTLKAACPERILQTGFSNFQCRRTFWTRRARLRPSRSARTRTSA